MSISRSREDPTTLNDGAFHEDCTLMIAKRLEQAIAPQWLRIGGYWYPRGGVRIRARSRCPSG